jgi:hypothetical protein
MQGEECFKIAKRVWETPPSNIDTADFLELKRAITRIISPGVYKDPSGEEVQIFGPAIDRCADRPERAFLITFRYQSGANRGLIETIPLFGDNGFFDLSKNVRYTRLEKQPDV